ncbi:MAG TPA: hypothetical protein VN692_17695 [Steroidobacteraceae bacterium]|nr:hypothetical protein [Steroidobacteraceae bacterium]
MNDVRAEQRTPQRRMIFTGTNRFDVDMSKKPAGSAYKWLRSTIGGQEDPENLVMAEMNGWTPVPAERHPELAGLSAKKGSAIVRGGLMLVEQPAEYAKEAREMDQFQARHTVESQIQRLGLQARRNGAKGISRTNDVIGGEVVE